MKLHVFDFDGTLFASPLPPRGWKGKWWDNPTSLLPPFVPDQPGLTWWNSPVVSAALRSMADPDVMTVMITGRKRGKNLGRILDLLDQAGLTFDDVALTPVGMPTVRYKELKIAKYIRENPAIEIVEAWDDRFGHLVGFEIAVMDAGVEFIAHPVPQVRRPTRSSTQSTREGIIRNLVG